MINHCASFFLLLLSKGAIVHYAKSVTESLFALMKFMEALLNEYLPYSFQLLT